MERRVGLRARTDFGVITRRGARLARCRGIEVSSTGIIVDRGRAQRHEEMGLLVNLELNLPERVSPLRALARPVWSFGSQLALRFVRISDADRLTLAEHIDLQQHRGVALS
jgi:hypothetical protein